jgi:uroporphyrinogen-III synthase
MLALQDKRVLVTRTRHQSSDLALQLGSHGAVPILIPTIEIVPPESYEALDAALSKLDTFDWIVFTSSNAVHVFGERHSLSSTRAKIATIGPATARAVQGIGLQVDLIPPRYVAESLAESLVSDAGDKRILLIRAAEARDVLPDILTRAGATVTIADAYRNRVPADSIPALQSLFASPKTWPDAITFTSASTVRNLFLLLEAADIPFPSAPVLASIGPITSQAINEHGFTPTLEATEPTIAALVRALSDFFEKKE